MLARVCPLEESRFGGPSECQFNWAELEDRQENVTLGARRGASGDIRDSLPRAGNRNRAA